MKQDNILTVVTHEKKPLKNRTFVSALKLGEILFKKLTVNVFFKEIFGGH